MDAVSFLFYIDRLRRGETQSVVGSFPPSVFAMEEEKELLFPSSVRVDLKGYLSEEHLVLHLQASTEVAMPCAVCNEFTRVTLSVPHLYHTESLSDIDSLFDAREVVREALLIELPHHVECIPGQCPKRGDILPFSSQKQTYFPFTDL